MVKVGFIINFKKNSWLGGYNYFINLFRCIALLKNKKIKPVIITDNLGLIKKDKLLRKFEIIETKLVDKSNFYARVIQKISLLILKKYFYKNFREKKIKILSHLRQGKKLKINSFPWFPDFQEIHLPENFHLKIDF